MSGPSTPTPTSTTGSTATPQTANPAVRQNPVAVIMPKWLYFVKQAQLGAMADESVKAIRGILKGNVRTALYQGFVTHKFNIYENLPPALDPRLPWKNEPVSLSREDYERESRIVLGEIARARMAATATATATAGGAGGSTSTMATPGTSSPSRANTPTSAAQLNAQTQPGSSPGLPSAAPSPAPSNQSRPPLQSSSSITSSGANATGSMPNGLPNVADSSTPRGSSPARPMAQPDMPIPPGIMPLFELKRYIAVQNINERNKKLEAEPGLKERYENSVAFYRARQRTNPPPQSGQSTPGRPVRPPGSALATTSAGPSTPTVGAGPGTAPPSATGKGSAATSNASAEQTSTAKPTKAASQRQTKANTAAQNAKAAQAQSSQQPNAVPTARIPPPIRPATPPVSSNNGTAKPHAIAPNPGPNPASSSDAKQTSGPAQAMPAGTSSTAAPQASPAQAGPSNNPSQPQTQNQQQSQQQPQPQGHSQAQVQGQSQPQSLQSQAGQNPNASTNSNSVPNPHHNPLNYPPQSFNPANGFGGPSRPFDLTLPPQRHIPPTPPPVPIESEFDRRKRKIREILSEDAPGLEIESGTYKVLGEYLDLFVEEAVEGAIRLSKHRKGAKVDLKDMALAIDMKHEMRVPGFNVQLPQKAHVPIEGERKRGKAVVPRAARKP